MTKSGFALSLFILVEMMVCHAIPENHKEMNSANKSNRDRRYELGKDTIYQSNDLILVKLSDHTYQHISFLNTNDFGRVSCNGMVVINDRQSIIFDTPTDDKSSEELINYVTQNLMSKIIAVIPTHFHEDCVGGISTFNHSKIPTYASHSTIQLLKEKGNKNAELMKGFDDRLTLSIGNKKVIAKYFGEGHTKDNIIGYFPTDHVLFGGCLVKESGATKGNLEDANIKEWPFTILKLKNEFPKIKTIIPGHGKSGGTDLLDYTVTLFK